MKIHEIIKERRLLKNLTQEQVANYLGVTTPAVNKWEKGNSYPDITILPSLARLLDTDLNTLLSFKEDLTNQEIVHYINEISNIIEDDFEKGYIFAMEIIEEYPTCYDLLVNVAIVLDGSMTLHDMENSEYQQVIESLYNRALCSDKITTRTQTQSMLISKYMKQHEYQKVEELLNQIPDYSFVDKKHLQAKLYLEYNELDKAARLEEERLLTSISIIQESLIYLLTIALKDNRKEDASYIADVSKQSANLFDMWKYSSYVAPFTLYSKTKNKMACIKLLPKMLASMTTKWKVNDSPLYRHIKTNPNNEDVGAMVKKNLLNAIEHDEETTFLKENQEVKDIIKKYKE